MESDEIKKVLLEILKYVDTICKENNINYSLGHGTLLGAIRHKGFIPWDDDIDIFLKRPEYNRLIEVLYSKNDTRYKVFSLKDEGYFYPYAKVSDMSSVILEKNWPDYQNLGLNIDVFPIDYLPEGREKEYYDKTKQYEKCLYNCLTDIAYADDNKIKHFIKKILRHHAVNNCRKKGEKYWKEKINSMTKIADSNKMACIVTGEYSLWDKKMFENYIDVEFENNKFSAVRDYDEMLKSIYGDYMKLPPENERESYHDFKAYWK